jgi:anti-sigma factor RsiW
MPRPVRSLEKLERRDHDLLRGAAVVTCREFADFIGDYLTGELPLDVRARFDHHLELCVNCQRYMTSYEETVKLGQGAFSDDSAAVPAAVPQELIDAILAARRRSN